VLAYLFVRTLVCYQEQQQQSLFAMKKNICNQRSRSKKTVTNLVNAGQMCNGAGAGITRLNYHHHHHHHLRLL